MNKQTLIAPEPPASGNIQAARVFSFDAVAPSATAAVRLSQNIQTIGGNQINAGRDPRRRAQAGEGHEAPRSPAPASLMAFGRAPGMLTFWKTSRESLTVTSQAREHSLEVPRSAPDQAIRTWHCDRIVSPAG